MPKITIDGKDYDPEQLSNEATSQLTSLQVTDAEIQRVQIQLAIAQTARNVYATALKSALSDSLLEAVSESGSIKI